MNAQRFFRLLVAGALLASQASAQFRSIDGSGNNPAHPERGMAGIPLLRTTTIGYADGLAAPAGSDRPSARALSNALAAQSGPLLNEVKASDFVWQWGQFLDHDLDLTPGAVPPEVLDIAVPLGDPHFDPFFAGNQTLPFTRSEYVVDGSGVRQQVNRITAFIDGSMIYGSDLARSLALRALDGTGRLKTSKGNLLPFNLDGLDNAGGSSPELFLAGDVRANEQLGLTAMHTLFMREHNFWAGIFSRFPIVDDEMVYQLARRIVGAEIQAITYNEFLPVLLGPGALPPFRGYNPSVDAGIENAFSSAAFRVGHTMLSPTLLRLDRILQPIPAGNISLANSFFNPSEIVKHGIDPLLRGLALQKAQRTDMQVIDPVRNFLFGPPGAGGMDLPALNIQRGRDHGLPDYNRLRMDYGLAPKQSFAEITSDAHAARALQQAYGSLDRIDPWVGALAEDHVQGGLVGELVRAVLVDQFTRLRDGDSFWYQTWMPPAMIRFIEHQKLALVVRRCTQIRFEIPSNVFRAPNRRY